MDFQRKKCVKNYVLVEKLCTIDLKNLGYH